MRAGNVTFGDRLLEAPIAVASALGLDITNGREALLERATRRDHRARHAEGRRELEQLHIVTTGRRDLSLEEDVRVAIDEAGQHGGGAEVEHFSSRRCWPRTRRVNGGDAITLDQDFLIRARLRARAIDERARTDDNGVRRCRSARRYGRFLRQAQTRQAQPGDAERDETVHGEPRRDDRNS